jgi:flavin reductase (DIM6/NTAB) family NADH-FMN oxidoreductase RutF
MKTIDPKNTPTATVHSQLLAAVAPRPIAFASTIDKNGNVNLSPYSFFNVFSAKPPIAIFSPARRVRDNTIKHTLENVYETKEVVINIVNYPMVQQMSLSSTEYPKGVNEFVKAGFTELPSEMVKPPRVKEAPVQLECKVKEVIELGQEAGAGNLIICEIVLIHINEDVLGENGLIDQHKIDLVARMGYNWYCRASGDSLFEVPKPLTTLGIGVDAMPEHIRKSQYLTGNHLGMLGNVEQLPDETSVNEFKLLELSDLFIEHQDNPAELEKLLAQAAINYLDKGLVEEAWKTLLAFNPR